MCIILLEDYSTTYIALHGLSDDIIYEYQSVKGLGLNGSSDHGIVCLF